MACHDALAVMTPYYGDRENRLPGVQRYYHERGLPFRCPTSDLPPPFRLKRRQQLSVGFYMAYRLVMAEIAISVIGFTGVVTKWHDGQKELQYLASHPLISFHSMIPPA